MKNVHESEQVEFKSTFQKEVIETIVSFANSKGGKIFRGIRQWKNLRDSCIR